MLWQFLGQPPERPERNARVDTQTPRRDAIDMALMNVYICTRGEWQAEATQSAPSDVHSSLLGHYAEFGVYQGNAFAHAYNRAADMMPWMRFFAFDSFEGLPAIKGHDQGGEFFQGQFACDRQTFERRLVAQGVDMSRVVITEGWFDATLTREFCAENDLNVVSVAFIDCDLYESCVPVLKFLTPLLRQGSILMFDDWLNFRADRSRGVQRATHEWLSANPHVSLIPWTYFCHHGRSFIVNNVKECDELATLQQSGELLKA